jgi:hypothetical protein
MSFNLVSESVVGEGRVCIDVGIGGIRDSASLFLNRRLTTSNTAFNIILSLVSESVVGEGRVCIDTGGAGVISLSVIDCEEFNVPSLRRGLTMFVGLNISNTVDNKVFNLTSEDT